MQGKNIGEVSASSKKVRETHVELNLDDFQNNFKKMTTTRGMSTSEFYDGVKMRLFALPDLGKSDKAKG